MGDRLLNMPLCSTRHISCQEYYNIYNSSSEQHDIVLYSADKVTYKESKALNKTQALMKSMNMVIWVIGTLNQIFTRSAYTKIKVAGGKSPFFLIGPFFTLCSICLNIGFSQDSFVKKCDRFLSRYFRSKNSIPSNE